jgi:hypothetical protein
MPTELPFRAGCFYDAEAIAAAFVSGPQAVSVRTVRRWIAGAPALQSALVRVGGRSWLPGAALVSWLGGSSSVRPEQPRDVARGLFLCARSEGELRRKVINLEVANG